MGSVGEEVWAGEGLAGGVEDGSAEGGEFGEEVREGFADAGRVVEADAWDAEA